VIDPDHRDFLNPADMPEAICRYCRTTGQTAPETPAQFARCIFEGLALKSRIVLEQLGRISAHPIRVLHIIGGGSMNETLCQFTANATGLPVIAGPMEATAVGNLLVQAMGLGIIGSLDELRAIVRESFPLKRYEPEDDPQWQAAYERFRDITGA
jgi:rhamnulokinase